MWSNHKTQWRNLRMHKDGETFLLNTVLIISFIIALLISSLLLNFPSFLNLPWDTAIRCEKEAIFLCQFDLDLEFVVPPLAYKETFIIDSCIQVLKELRARWFGVPASCHFDSVGLYFNALPRSTVRDRTFLYRIPAKKLHQHGEKTKNQTPIDWCFIWK